MEKVVVTGLGAVSPIGNSAKETWDNLIEGVSGTGPITLFDGKDLLVKAACEVKNFNPNDYLPAKLSRRRARFQQFASVAVMEALEQSGLEITSQNAPRISVIISSGIGGLEALEENIIKMIEEGVRKLNPFLIPMLMSNGAAGLTSIDYGIKGPAISVASACASAQDGIGIALMMLRSEVIDAAIVGAARQW